jgi:hypothetical protein
LGDETRLRLNDRLDDLVEVLYHQRLPNVRLQQLLYWQLQKVYGVADHGDDFYALLPDVVGRDLVCTFGLVAQEGQYHFAQTLFHVLLRKLVNPYDKVHQRYDILLGESFNVAVPLVVQLEDVADELLLGDDPEEVGHLEVDEVV